MSKENDLSVALTPEIVETAYHLLLGRPPENDKVIQEGVAFHKNLSNLRQNFSTYPEGRRAIFDLLSKNVPFDCIKIKSKRGFYIYINLRDTGVSREIFLFDEFEPHNELFILENLDPNEVMLDIGANVGWFSMIAAQKIYNAKHKNADLLGRIIGFEANLNTAKLLTGSVQDSVFRDLVQIYNVALSSENGVLSFEDMDLGNIGGGQVRQLPDNFETQNHHDIKAKYEGKGEAFGECKQTAIPAVPLDSLLSRETQKIGFVKIDVEGSEPFVLRGAEETFSRHKPKILIEFHKDKLEYSSDCTPADLALQLDKMNFDIFDFQHKPSEKLSPKDVESIVEDKGYYDFIALPK